MYMCIHVLIAKIFPLAILLTMSVRGILIFKISWKAYFKIYFKKYLSVSLFFLISFLLVSLFLSPYLPISLYLKFQRFLQSLVEVFFCSSNTKQKKVFCLARKVSSCLNLDTPTTTNYKESLHITSSFFLVFLHSFIQLLNDIHLDNYILSTGFFRPTGFVLDTGKSAIFSKKIFV